MGNSSKADISNTIFEQLSSSRQRQQTNYVLESAICVLTVKWDWLCALDDEFAGRKIRANCG